MGKYEIEMEITGFRLKIRGEREDIPVIKENLQHQLAGIVEPAANIARSRLPPSTIEAEIVNNGSNGAHKRPRRARRTVTANGESNSTALEFQHDPSQFGVPPQTWTAGKKIVWLLYIVLQQAQTKELPGPVIAETFNKHFRQSGPLKKVNMPRDLGILKQKVPALVSDQTSGSRITWFLTNEGTKDGLRLVVEAKGGGVTNT